MKVLLEKLWPAQFKTQGGFVLFFSQMMSWEKKKKLAPLNNVSVFDTFCERGPYCTLQLKLMGRGARF